MRMRKFTYAFLVLAFFASCSDDGKEPLSCCGHRINIPISEYILSFNSQEGVDSVFVYDTYYTDWWFEDNAMKIESSWFSAAKKDDSTIVVSVKQNDTEKKRSQDVYIKDSLYSGSFRIVQCPEPIELSRDELLFGAEGGVDSVTIITEGNYRLLPSPGIIGGYENRGVINFFYDPIHIEGPWFSIDVPEEKKIIFSVNENTTGEERGIIITLDYENRCEEIKIIQPSE